MRKPKLRELKEAVTALVKGPYTSKFPKVAPTVPEHFRGTPTYVEEDCVGCGSCAQVCPAGAIEIVDEYRDRRDALCEGLLDCGWEMDKPKATMFVWAQIPEPFRSMGSLEFSKLLTEKAKVAVSPGIGFGPHGDEHVRFALVENRPRIRQAVRGIRHFLQDWRADEDAVQRVEKAAAG